MITFYIVEIVSIDSDNNHYKLHYNFLFSDDIIPQLPNLTNCMDVASVQVTDGTTGELMFDYNDGVKYVAPAWKEDWDEVYFGWLDK